MVKDLSKKSDLVRIENKFLFKAHYYLTANEQKVVLFLASHIDPKKQEDFHKQVVAVKELERELKKDDTKRGGMYEEIEALCERLMERMIIFPTEIEYEGRRMKGFINWFQSIIATRNEKGEVAVEFMFSEYLKPFLLRLKEYVPINRMEIASMTGSHTIHLYQIFKAERERTRKYRKVSKLEYELKELKALLGISKKYKVLKDFRRRVLDPVKEEINEVSQEIRVNYEYIKSGRKVSGIKFTIFDAVERPDKPERELADFVPTSEDIDALPMAQRKAYFDLVEFGVIQGIAFKQLLPRIKGSEVVGFEDYFVSHAIEHFKTKSSSPENIGAFVNWWTKTESFDSQNGQDWAIIMEQVIGARKKLQQEDNDAFSNRLIARDMSYNEFVEWYRNQSKEGQNQGS